MASFCNMLILISTVISVGDTFNLDEDTRHLSSGAINDKSEECACGRTAKGTKLEVWPFELENKAVMSTWHKKDRGQYCCYESKSFFGSCEEHTGYIKFKVTKPNNSYAKDGCCAACGFDMTPPHNQWYSIHSRDQNHDPITLSPEVCRVLDEMIDSHYLPRIYTHTDNFVYDIDKGRSYHMDTPNLTRNLKRNMSDGSIEWSVRHVDLKNHFSDVHILDPMTTKALENSFNLDEKEYKSGAYTYNLHKGLSFQTEKPDRQRYLLRNGVRAHVTDQARLLF